MKSTCTLNRSKLIKPYSFVDQNCHRRWKDVFNPEWFTEHPSETVPGPSNEQRTPTYLHIKGMFHNNRQSTITPNKKNKGKKI